MIWGSITVSADPPELWLIEPEGIVYEGDTITIKWECPVWTVRMELEARLTFQGVRPQDPIFETEWDGLTFTEGCEDIDIPVQNSGQLESLSFRLSCYDSQDIETVEVDFLTIYPEPYISDPDGNTNGNQNGQTSQFDAFFMPFIGIFVLAILLVVALIIISFKKKEEPPRQHQQPPSQ